jgi:hypothetical protein
MPSFGGGFGERNEPQIPDGFAEGSLTWQNVSKRIVGRLADSWFAEYSPVPISATLSPEALAYSEPHLETFAPYYFAAEEPKVLPGMTINFSNLGAQTDIDQTQVGTALIDVLQEAGVSWFYETRFPISPLESIEIPESRIEGVAEWTNFFGMPVHQKFRVYVDGNGRETCVWFTPALVATRPFEHLTQNWLQNDSGTFDGVEIPQSEIDQGALSFGQWSTEIYIPVLAKSLFYLAETPFPSSFLSFPRQSAFEAVLTEDRPRPFIVNARYEEARGVFQDTGAELLVTSTFMPNVIHFGWSFSTTNKLSLLKNLKTMSTGLVKISSILEDGYLNANSSGSQSDFDTLLLSAVGLSFPGSPNEGLGGFSRWVPTTRIGFLMHETNTQAQLASSADSAGDLDTARRLFEWVSYDGAGPMVPACVNSLVFRWLLREQNWQLAESILEGAYLMKMGRESINALSNWGISLFLQGRLDDAKEKFELVLQSGDVHAESEACYYLAEIFVVQDDEVLAGKYRVKCAESGGYDSATGQKGGSGFDANISEESSQPASETSSVAPRYCSNCGTKFEGFAGQFCSYCGRPRG